MIEMMRQDDEDDIIRQDTYGLGPIINDTPHNLYCY